PWPDCQTTDKGKHRSSYTLSFNCVTRTNVVDEAFSRAVQKRQKAGKMRHPPGTSEVPLDEVKHHRVQVSARGSSLNTVVFVGIKERLELHAGLYQGVLKSDRILNMNVVVPSAMNQQEPPLQ